jgi:hypothetical protein
LAPAPAANPIRKKGGDIEDDADERPVILDTEANP